MRGVTLCGKCIDRSELGNIIFGYSGGKLAIEQETLLSLAVTVGGALRGIAELATARIGYRLSSRTFNDANTLCREITEYVDYTDAPFGWNYWNYADFGQDPDVSECTPCTVPLPSWFPHTTPRNGIQINGVSISIDAAGTSVWANSSTGQGDPNERFYVAQIAGLQFLSPELCSEVDGLPNYIANFICGSGSLNSFR